jgi:hypothetical protein
MDQIFNLWRNFMALLPYLPATIGAGIHVYNNYKQAESLSEIEVNDYNLTKFWLRNTALAIAGYVVYSRYAEQLGAGLIPLSFVAYRVFPAAVRLGASGYFTVTSALGLVDAARKRDVPAIAKNLALTVFAYFATTQKMNDWVWHYANKPLPMPLPINAALHVLSNFKGRDKLEDVQNEDGKTWDILDKYHYNEAVTILYNTAIAVAGYVAVSKFADKWLNGLLPIALVAANVFPTALWIGTTGYGTAVGAAGAIQAIKQRNPTQLAAYAALTLFSYFGTTIRHVDIHPKIQQFLHLPD